MKKTIAGFGVVLSLALAVPAFASTFIPTAVCSSDPLTTLNWHVENDSTTTDQTFSWERLTGLEFGSNVVTASSSLTFSTGSSATTTPDTLEFSWDEGIGTTTADIVADTTACPVATPTVLAPVQVSFAAGGHATDTQMQGLLSPEGYQTYLAGRSQSNDTSSDPTISIMEQIVSLLTQEIALFQNSR